MRSLLPFLVACWLQPASSLAAESHDLASYVLLADQRIQANDLEVLAGDVGVNRGLLLSTRRFDAPTSNLVAETVRILPSSRCAHLFANSDAGAPRATCGPAAPFVGPIVAARATASHLPAPDQ